MTKKECYRGFVYYGEHIYSPLGKKSEHNERMRGLYAHLHDSGHYKVLPHDALAADEVLRQRGCPVCGKRLEDISVNPD